MREAGTRATVNMLIFVFTFKANYVNVIGNFVNCSVDRPLEKLSSFVRVLTSKPSTLASWLAASVILALSDPFHMSDTVGLLGRLIYWVVTIGVALQLATGLHVISPALQARCGVILSRLLMGVVFAVLFGPFIYGFNALFFPERYATMMAWPQLLGFLLIIFAAIGMVMDAVSYQFTGRLSVKAQDAPPVVEEEEVAPAFLQRLDPKLGSDLVRLSMQDHYVEAHTSQGSQLILMRLADAIKELDGIDGLQVHRSHWVALSRVKGVQRAQGRLALVTSDDAEVPVSRSYRDAVKTAGLLD